MTTPHGKAADDLVAAGPVEREHFLRHVARYVPAGQAVATAMRSRQAARKRKNYAAEIDNASVAPGYEKKGGDLTAMGSRTVATDTLFNRLRNGTFIINDDGLIQHRDWKP